MNWVASNKYKILSFLLIALVVSNAMGGTTWLINSLGSQQMAMPEFAEAAEPECYEADNEDGTNPDCLDCQICEGAKGSGECVDNCTDPSEFCSLIGGGSCVSCDPADKPSECAECERGSWVENPPSDCDKWKCNDGNWELTHNPCDGLECGKVNDGCGNLIDCPGECSKSWETCDEVNNVCEPCASPPDSSVCSGKSGCGTFKNVCNEYVDCGCDDYPNSECNSTTVGSTGNCVCTPDSEPCPLGAECGTVNDGCGGEVQCGSSDPACDFSHEACTNFECVDVSVPTTPPGCSSPPCSPGVNGSTL